MCLVAVTPRFADLEHAFVNAAHLSPARALGVAATWTRGGNGADPGLLGMAFSTAASPIVATFDWNAFSTSLASDAVRLFFTAMLRPAKSTDSSADVRLAIS